MWNAKKSVSMSLAVTYFCGGVLLCAMVLAPSLLRWYYAGHANLQTLMRVLLTAFYVCCPAAVCALTALARLLHNIRREEIFTTQNVKMLRLLSWCCFFVTAVTLVCGWWYLPFYIICIAAAFFGLILRVVKNVIQAATALKEENDMTI